MNWNSAVPVAKLTMSSSQYLIRFVQQHPTFRQSELESCAILNDCDVQLPLQFVDYSDLTPFAILELKDEKTARRLIQRSILTQYLLRIVCHTDSFRAIFQLWGYGSSYDDLHKDVVNRTKSRWVNKLSPCSWLKGVVRLQTMLLLLQNRHI